MWVRSAGLHQDGSTNVNRELSVSSANGAVSATESGTFEIAGKTVHRLGYGAMRITGPGIWGEPADRAESVAVLRRAIELGVDFIDTADSYGPGISEEIIAEALHPYPEQVLVATKVGLV
ncbi:MAG: aldo/keto reductase, partial [Actinomycetota bacterium]|nr:aldo/keto reductase [Actinomycetota bacterium]